MKNKEITKRKMIDAIGKLLTEEGYESLGVNRIAKAAGIHKKLIYRYFDNADNLIENYIVEKDFYMAFTEKLFELVKDHREGTEKELIKYLMEQEFEYFYNEVEMQHIVKWQLSAGTPLIRSVSNAREHIREKVMELTNSKFLNTGVNFNAVNALITGGLYHAVLNAKNNGSSIYGIDINQESQRKMLLFTAKQIIDWAFEARNAS